MQNQDDAMIEASDEIERMRSETEFINETRGAREERLYITSTVMKFLNLSSCS